MADNRVWIFDSTMRDGEQSPGCSMNTPEKLKMAVQLQALGVDILEAGFPIASEDDYEAVRQIGAQADSSVAVAALARATRADIERAAKALETSKRPRLHVFLATSDIHLEHKLHFTRDQAVDAIGNGIRYAKSYIGDVEFSAEDATRTAPAFLAKCFQTAWESGAETLNAPDTVGCTVPEEYAELMRYLRMALGEGPILSVHCHNDLGLAVANSLAAVAAGARQVECTINGIGERAGNAALEEIVMAMKVRNDKMPFETGIRTELLYPCSQLLTDIIGFGVQPNKAIVGKNAFAHEAGIHQDGVLKNPITYEIMSPQTVGVPRNQIVLGKHSGRHALQQRYADLGVRVDSAQLAELYRRFVQLADRKKVVLDADLMRLVQHLENEPLSTTA